MSFGPCISFLPCLSYISPQPISLWISLVHWTGVALPRILGSRPEPTYQRFQRHLALASNLETRKPFFLQNNIFRLNLDSHIFEIRLSGWGGGSWLTDWQSKFVRNLSGVDHVNVSYGRWWTIRITTTLTSSQQNEFCVCSCHRLWKISDFPSISVQ